MRGFSAQSRGGRLWGNSMPTIASTPRHCTVQFEGFGLPCARIESNIPRRRCWNGGRAPPPASALDSPLTVCL